MSFFFRIFAAGFQNTPATMIRTFEDYDPDLGFVDAHYRNHQLRIDDFHSTGFAAAAWVATCLVATEEGEARGIARLNTAEIREELMLRYEDETFREDGGLLRDEAKALFDWLVQIDELEDWYGTLFFSARQHELWQDLCREYMVRLVEREIKRENSMLLSVSDTANFLDWLVVRLARRSKLLVMRGINWLRLDSIGPFVEQLEEKPNYMAGGVEQSELITHLETGQKETEIFDEYFECRRAEHAARTEYPSNEEWMEEEQANPFSEKEREGYTALQLRELEEWQERWLRYFYRRLGRSYRRPKKIWGETTTDRQQARITQYLCDCAMEDSWCTLMVGMLKVLQQRGIIRRSLKSADLAHFCDSILHTEDYSRGDRRTQFSRKWTEIRPAALDRAALIWEELELKD